MWEQGLEYGQSILVSKEERRLWSGQFTNDESGDEFPESKVRSKSHFSPLDDWPL
jgi:hypothetical protein